MEEVLAWQLRQLQQEQEQDQEQGQEELAILYYETMLGQPTPNNFPNAVKVD